jgi:hypothetical protein
MRVISMDRPRKRHQPLEDFNFFILTLDIWKEFWTTKYKNVSILLILRQTACIESILPIRWHTFIWWNNPPKCCAILVWIAGCWNSSNILLTSHNPKNNCWLSPTFGDQFGGKDCGLCPYSPSAKEVGGLGFFCMKQLRTLNFYQIFKIKI